MTRISVITTKANSSCRTLRRSRRISITSALIWRKKIRSRNRCSCTENYSLYSRRRRNSSTSSHRQQRSRTNDAESGRLTLQPANQSRDYPSSFNMYVSSSTLKRSAQFGYLSYRVIPFIVHELSLGCVLSLTILNLGKELAHFSEVLVRIDRPRVVVVSIADHVLKSRGGLVKFQLMKSSIFLSYEILESRTSRSILERCHLFRRNELIAE